MLPLETRPAATRSRWAPGPARSSTTRSSGRTSSWAAPARPSRRARASRREWPDGRSGGTAVTDRDHRRRNGWPRATRQPFPG